MHIAYYIWLYGSHLNIHTGPQEHNHIANSKKPSQQTQKRKRDFDWQLGNRLNDQYSIEFATNQIKFHNVGENNLKRASNKSSKPSIDLASKFEVFIKLDVEANKVIVEYKWLTSSMQKNQLSQSLLQLISIYFFYTEPKPNQIQGVHVKGITEYTHKEMTYRAHPCYKNDSSWFDWVLIAWNIPYVEYLTSRVNDDSPDYDVLSKNDDNTDDEKIQQC